MPRWLGDQCCVDAPGHAVREERDVGAELCHDVLDQTVGKNVHLFADHLVDIGVAVVSRLRDGWDGWDGDRFDPVLYSSRTTSANVT